MNQRQQDWFDLITGKRRGLLASLLRGVLIGASVRFGLANRLRNKLYDWGWLRTHHAAVPVVVVGNLTMGGTGKTPAVEYIARYYRQHGRRVAILSRGYGASDGRNDEALVLEANLDDVPHLQAADRVASAHTAVEELESELLVLDDGFQHRRLHRDLDIVLVDATQPLDWCLPAGLLREPRSGLRRANAIIVTRSDQAATSELQTLRQVITRHAPRRPIALARHAPIALHNTHEEIPPEALRGKTVAALCGIGNPSGFLTTLRMLGATIVDQKTYPDHHAYQRRDVVEIETWARGLPADTWLVTTQKDWVKLRIDRLGERPLWSLRITLEITDGRDALEAVLLGVLNHAVGKRPAVDGSSLADPAPAGDSSVRKDVYDPANACSV
jgi:tetraacyldisaccharide 4'-kinase